MKWQHMALAPRKPPQVAHIAVVLDHGGQNLRASPTRCHSGATWCSSQGQQTGATKLLMCGGLADQREHYCLENEQDLIWFHRVVMLSLAVVLA